MIGGARMRPSPSRSGIYLQVPHMSLGIYVMGWCRVCGRRPEIKESNDLVAFFEAELGVQTAIEHGPPRSPDASERARYHLAPVVGRSGQGGRHNLPQPAAGAPCEQGNSPVAEIRRRPVSVLNALCDAHSPGFEPEAQRLSHHGCRGARFALAAQLNPAILARCRIQMFGPTTCWRSDRSSPMVRDI